MTAGGDRFLRLDGRVAIVTGGARGIGRATAERLAAAGARVISWDLDPGEAAATTGLGSDGLIVEQCVDVTDPDSIERALADPPEGASAVDILVNNAGIAGRTAPLPELSDADWEQTLKSNLSSAFFCCRALLPGMAARGRGAIVNVASVTGKDGNPNQIPYSVSKAGVISLTKTLAREVAPEIRVNCVAPALIRTGMLDNLPPESIDYALERIPMARVGTPEEVASVVHFLASDDAGFVTGQCYDISGGRSTY